MHSKKSFWSYLSFYSTTEQVVSLTLCDDEHTAGQSQLFFSHFHINQFTQLESLTLIKMEPEVLKFIFLHLWKLFRLRSLSFDYISAQCAQANEFSQTQCLFIEQTRNNFSTGTTTSITCRFFRHFHMEISSHFASESVNATWSVRSKFISATFEFENR